MVPAGVLPRGSYSTSDLSSWPPPVKVISVLSGLNLDLLMFFHVSAGRENIVLSLHENLWERVRRSLKNSLKNYLV